jgi:hypothetical protein
VFGRIGSDMEDVWTLRAYAYVANGTDQAGKNLAIFYTNGSLIAQPTDADGMPSAMPARILDSSGRLVDFVPLGQTTMLFPQKSANATGQMLIMPGKDFGSRVLALFRNSAGYQNIYTNGSTFAIVAG